MLPCRKRTALIGGDSWGCRRDLADDKVLGTISAIHDAGLNPELWPKALGAVTHLIGGTATTLEVVDRKTATHRSFLGFNVQPPEEISYLEHYAATNPRKFSALRARPGDIDFDFRNMDDKAIDHSAFYMEFLAPMDLRYFVGGILKAEANELRYFGVQRTARQGHIQQPEIALAQLLVPHMSQALDVTRRLETADAARRSLEQAFDWLSDGVALIGPRGNVIYANRAFERIIVARDGVGVRSGALEFLSADSSERLKIALALVHSKTKNGLLAGGSDFAIPRPSGAPAYLFSIRPLPAGEVRARDQRAVAIVFARDPVIINCAGSRIYREVLGLTEAEASFAQALQAGILPKAYALSRGVSLNTVYTHLRRLKEKTGCHRLPELMKKLNDVKLPIEPE